MIGMEQHRMIERLGRHRMIERLSRHRMIGMERRTIQRQGRLRKMVRHRMMGLRMTERLVQRMIRRRRQLELQVVCSTIGPVKIHMKGNDKF